ncbi:GYD domain-containing protein [Lutimaribacter marinistellae]|uniref:GYD domain-containing protein n=1 Tax=Lutimaribacter marinistellae TaxID=1820329 RepID=A0ABV7TCV1_9RHOB
MALYMWMARYTPAAAKAIVEGDSNREEMARQTVEAAGGKLLGFYGLIGQDYHVALIADMPGVGEYVGVVVTASMGGAIESFKTIPMYDMDEMDTVRKTHQALKAVYSPPS